MRLLPRRRGAEIAAQLRPRAPARRLSRRSLSRLSRAAHARAGASRTPAAACSAAHADLEAVYKDTATFSSDKKVEFAPKYGDSPLYEHHTTSLVFNDPPLHTRVRRIIAGALTPRAIAGMERAGEALVDGLLDDMAAQGRAST